MNKVLKIIDESSKVLYGKRDKVELSFITLLAGGNLLIEDTPGVGKTTLAKFLGHALGFQTSRIQFTNDLLPSDIIGSHIFQRETSDFILKKGPIFGELILADEINRGNSKTQSALLQAMEEKKVSIDETTFELPDNHVIVATQNPGSQIGTFPLPESQLDRFLMKISMGAPPKDLEKELLLNQTGEVQSFEHLPKLKKTEFLDLRKSILKSKISSSIVEYIVSLLDYSRHSVDFRSLSTRSGIDLVNACKSYQFLRGKEFLTPEDVQFLFPFVMGHRLISSDVHHEFEEAKRFLQLVNVY